MTETTTNQVAAKAKANMTILFAIVSDDKTLERRVGNAYENESDLKSAVEKLESNLKRSVELLNETLHLLQTDRTGCLNASGVLQTMNHDIDCGIIDIQSRVKARCHYKDLLKHKS